MGKYISDGELKVRCNIKLTNILHLSIHEKVNAHAISRITAILGQGSFDVASQRFSGEPLYIYTVRCNRELLLFSGVIYNVNIKKESSYDVITLSAYTLSWLTDLEKKNRSFQSCKETISSLAGKLAQENSFDLLCSVDDKTVTKPLIQYQETDWEFMLRLSSHIHVPVLAPCDYERKGIYLGFREKEEPVELHSAREKWQMDAANIRTEKWRDGCAAYYEVETDQIANLGQGVIYKGMVLWIYQAEKELRNGRLQCRYQLVRKQYDSFPIIYNPSVKCLSLLGTVLDRIEETVKIHLDIDEMQKDNEAYPYLWLPEYGNMLYCMPEKGSRIRLLIPGEDEQNAICVHCVRQTGQPFEKIQNPHSRWFETDSQKKLALRSDVIELLADGGSSKISLQDGIGNSIYSSDVMTIKAKGNITIKGNNVQLNAPSEITVVKRQLGDPSVVNICHNLDSMGASTQFKNLKEPNIDALVQEAAPHAKTLSDGERRKLELRKKEKEKLKFKMNKLLEENSIEDIYELGPSVMNVISSIPQSTAQDRLSQIAAGFRPITGNIKGE